MDVTLILSLIKLGLEVFQDERKDRFLKQYLELEKDYQDEINKGIDSWSDLKLDRMRADARRLGQLVVEESRK
jgi:hypothetical protein